MKKTALAGVICLVLVSMSFAFSIDGSIYTAGVTRYLDRGLVVNDGPAIQPGLSLSSYGVTLETWSSCHGFASPDMFDEWGLYASCKQAIPYAEFLSLTAGYEATFYNPKSNFPFLTKELSEEVYVTLSADVISNPYVTIIHSINVATKYNYLEAGVSYEYEIGEMLGGNIAFGAEASIGMDLNFVKYEIDEITAETKETEEAKLSAAGLNLYANYKIGDFTITPSVFMQFGINDAKEEETGKLYKNLASGSLMINYNFTIGQKESKPEDTKASAE